MNSYANDSNAHIRLTFPTSNRNVLDYKAVPFLAPRVSLTRRMERTILHYHKSDMRLFLTKKQTRDTSSDINLYASVTI